MVSDFLVAHPSGPFYCLSQKEMDECIAKYPNIEKFDGVNYVNKTCTGSFHPGQDNYFNSETILCPFEKNFL